MNTFHGDCQVLPGHIPKEKAWDEPFVGKKQRRPKTGALLLPGGKQLRKQPGPRRSAKDSDILPLLKQVGLEEHFKLFCQHDLDIAELRHWNVLDLTRLLELPAGPLRRLLAKLEEAGSRVVGIWCFVGYKSSSVCISFRS